MTLSPTPYADTACFTGHRALPRTEIDALTARLQKEILSLRARGVHHFLSGGAVGFDLLAAVTVLNLQHAYPDLRLSMILPCEDHMQNWSEHERSLLARILPRAHTVLYTAREYSRGCMFLRDRYLVDHSAHCIAYLTRERGGTYYTVGYAKKKGIPIYNLAQSLRTEEKTD